MATAQGYEFGHDPSTEHNMSLILRRSKRRWDSTLGGALDVGGCESLTVLGGMHVACEFKASTRRRLGG